MLLQLQTSCTTSNSNHVQYVCCLFVLAESFTSQRKTEGRFAQSSLSSSLTLSTGVFLTHIINHNPYIQSNPHPDPSRHLHKEHSRRAPKHTQWQPKRFQISSVNQGWNIIVYFIDNTLPTWPPAFYWWENSIGNI